MKMRTIRAVLVILLVVTGLSVATPLDDYIAKPDPSYSYKIVQTINHPLGKILIIDMKSQTWRSENEVNRTLWQHYLTVVVPNNVAFDTALLWITGGSNDRPAPTKPDGMLAEIAVRSRSVVAELKTVPNQPLVFPDDPDNKRYEDEIIAYTFDKFMRTEDPTWPLLLPMVKSAVRAMDTIQNLSSEKSDVTIGRINKFVVSGASKRGWTTWLTAAVDKRVCAIAPVVIDVLNMAPQMRHHYAAYGFYSSAIGDYEQMKVLDRLGSQSGDEIQNFIDPYSYRDRYTMPKFIINSAGDQFFLPDSSQFYYDDLPGDKRILYCANTDHGLDGSKADQALLAWYQSILGNNERPAFSWTFPTEGSVEVTTKSQPRKVTLWTATNPKARDFRLETIGKAWGAKSLEATGDLYKTKVPAPDEGWTAYFIELEFPSKTGVPYRFSTEVRVVPDTLPFAK